MQAYFRRIGILWVLFTLALLLIDTIPSSYKTDLIGTIGLGNNPLDFFVTYPLAGIVLIALDEVWRKTNYRIIQYLSYIALIYILGSFLLILLGLFFAVFIGVFILMGQLMFGP